jgi:sulfotransferase family protein
MASPRPLRLLRRRAGRALARLREPDRPPAPFIVGVPRSGTTLLRLMFDAHPELAIPPETHFLPKLIRLCQDAEEDEDARPAALELITRHRRWPDFGLDADEVRRRLAGTGRLRPGDAARAFYGAYAAKHGKTRWGEKTPQYLKSLKRIGTALPEAHFIHIIRDGRDVALSLLEVSWGPKTVEDAAVAWTTQIRRARRKARSVPHYSEVRYEGLVADPEPVVDRLCEFCDLRFDPVMLEYHRTATERMEGLARDLQLGGERGAIGASERARQHALVSEAPRGERAGRWRTEMEPRDVAAFEAIAGPTLAELGYELVEARAMAADTPAG